MRFHKQADKINHDARVAVAAETKVSSEVSQCLKLIVETSVATLLLRKSTRFHDKKNTRFTKKTLDYKSKLKHSENGQKMCCNANHRHCATHCKPETKKTGDSSNACVCLYRSLKLLTDDQVTSQRFNSKHLYQCFPIFFWLAPPFLTNKFLSPPYQA